MDEVEDQPGYEWLPKTLALLEADVEVPAEWINDDGLIEWKHAAEYYEDRKGEVDPIEARDFLRYHEAMIDWEEFDAWYQEVEDLPGYEWLEEALDLWEEDDDMLDWDKEAKELEERKGEVDPVDFADWLLENKDRIDWGDFAIWQQEVEDRDDYEWLDDALMLFAMFEAEVKSAEAQEEYLRHGIYEEGWDPYGSDEEFED